MMAIHATVIMHPKKLVEPKGRTVRITPGIPYFGPTLIAHLDIIDQILLHISYFVSMGFLLFNTRVYVRNHSYSSAVSYSYTITNESALFQRALGEPLKRRRPRS